MNLRSLLLAVLIALPVLGCRIEEEPPTVPVRAERVVLPADVVPQERSTANILMNPGFELVEAGKPKGWEAVSEATLSDVAHSGSKSAVALIDTYWYQAVKLEPNQHYVMGHYSRSDKKSGVRLQVNMLGAGGQQAGLFLVPLITGPDWNWAEKSFVTGPDVAGGVVYLGAQTADAPVLVDDVWLGKGTRIK